MLEKQVDNYALPPLSLSCILRMIFACFHSAGTDPVSIDCWKIKHKKGAIADAASLRTPNGIKSGLLLWMD